MTKTILITGGSRGIGAATAIAAGSLGWNVVLTYRSDARAAAQIAEKIETLGGQARAVASDVSVEADVISVFNMCKETFGQLDGLVNNAGILPEVGRLEDFDLARWNKTFAVNTTGTFLCCRQAVHLMSPRHGGHGGSIVNVSSMAAVLGAAHEFVDYGASKGAVDTLTIGLSKELGPDGIRVNGVRPGLIDTDIHGSAGDAARVERLAGGVPLGRAGTAAETAEAIIWLLSDAASYVTGTFISVSGGR
ncbi:SDR family oxidoreductase [Pararhizobium sp. IMCC21322]|uniref:SDR family oxidoreductase n=1 Tax=Pararhizobium sp. IMCC21322 TaxID=3067903 RepID=UPI0027419494|nr:SDR family oxidoreductase [Pararhizobium sp. IMCC21322]